MIRENGYILTNSHVVKPSHIENFSSDHPVNVTVTLYGESNAFSARVVGFNPEKDLAIIKIERSNLTYASFGNSDAINIRRIHTCSSETLLAYGNSVSFRNNKCGQQDCI